MKVKKQPASDRNRNVSSGTTRFDRRNDHRDHMLKESRKRAYRIVTLYEDLNPELAPECLLGELFYDIMHLCDRNAQWQSFEQAYRAALAFRCDYLEAETEWLQAEMAFLGSLGRADRC